VETVSNDKKNMLSPLAILVIVITLIIGYAVTDTCDNLQAIPRNSQRLDVLEKQMVQMEAMQNQLAELAVDIRWIKQELQKQ